VTVDQKLGEANYLKGSAHLIFFFTLNVETSSLDHSSVCFVAIIRRITEKEIKDKFSVVLTQLNNPLYRNVDIWHRKVHGA
jgi:hypothetical protein